MECITRDVDKIESSERRVYEAVFGHALREDQQVVLQIAESTERPNEAARRAALEEFHELCRQGTENREKQGISIEEADGILEEAIRAVRSQKDG